MSADLTRYIGDIAANKGAHRKFQAAAFEAFHDLAGEEGAP